MKIHNEEYEIFLNKAKYEDEIMEETFKNASLQTKDSSFKIKKDEE
jgi:hypothetical protein